MTDALVAAYNNDLRVPGNPLHPTGDITGSFDLLCGETNSIYNVITRISHDRILHLQFGRLPLEGGDRGDSGDGDDGGGVDKRARGAK